MKLGEKIQVARDVHTWFTEARRVGFCGINLNSEPHAEYFATAAPEVWHRGVATGIREYQDGMFRVSRHRLIFIGAMEPQ